MNTHQRNVRNRLSHARRQAGMTLLEIMVVVAIIGLGLAAFAWNMNKGFNSNDQKDETSAVTTVMAALPDVRSSSGYGTASLLPQLVAQDAIPTTWKVGGTAGAPTVTNSWNGAVTVTGATTQVTISIANVPKEACNKMVVKLSKGANFQSTKVNAATAVTGEYTSATAQTDCSAAANTIVWTTRN